MLQKEGKTYLGILEGLQRASSPLLWWLQHLQSWQHLQNRQGPQFLWWDKQQESRLQEELILALSCRAGQPRAAGTRLEGAELGHGWGDNKGVSIHLSPCLTAHIEPPARRVLRQSQDPRGTLPLSHFRPPWHTPTPSVLGICVEILTQTAEKFKGFWVKFS